MADQREEQLTNAIAWVERERDAALASFAAAARATADPHLAVPDALPAAAHWATVHLSLMASLVLEEDR